ncbi:MAG TPA: hydantoinase/oxoprolinase family protein [Sulfolobales archaeon]|nr:hydantoinase/oxoprolinase family protein [Sulfolobales archaeon]
MSWLVGIDIGGSFTDLVAFNTETGETRYSKVLTTYPDLSEGVFNALKEAGIDIDEIISVVHGTTIVINTIIEGKGVKTALITTKGFRDVVEIGRGNRPDMYNLHYRKPRPIVPRRLRFEVSERIKADGTIVRAIDVNELIHVINQIKKEEDVKSVAIVFLHSYANAIHEKVAEESVRKELPWVFVSASHKITKEYREYERSITTVLNAYVGPIASNYIDKLEAGFKGKLLLLQSASGVISADDAREAPIKLIESGPVAGTLGSLALGKSLGEQNIITFDSGSTTTKASLIYKGQPRFRAIYHVGGYISGWPVLVPSVEVSEVGIAGNSIIWFDAAGRIRIGPKSAGSLPGPACYGLGGKEPTITDMNVLMGRIEPKLFLGGKLPLKPELAENAFKNILETLGIPKDEAFIKLNQLASLMMSISIRNVSIERGFDPKDFTLIAYGGAGPLYASAIASILNIKKIIIPTKPAHFSAWGMVVADIRYDYVQTNIVPLSKFSIENIEKIYNNMYAEGSAKLKRLGIKDIHVIKYMDLRYSGQEHTLTIMIPEQYNAEIVRELFDTHHERVYGYSLKDYDVEIVNLRLAVIGVTPKPAMPEIQRGETSPSGKALLSMKEVLYEDKGWVRVPIYIREKLLARNIIEGPSVIVEEASTTILYEGDKAEIDDYGNIVIYKS